MLYIKQCSSPKQWFRYEVALHLLHLLGCEVISGCLSISPHLSHGWHELNSFRSFTVRLSYQQAVMLPAGERGEQIKGATQAGCFQPGDTKQIPTEHLNRGLACHYKYFIDYTLRTPQQLTASHLLSAWAPRLLSCLVTLFWWLLPELSQSRYFIVLWSNAMGITKY